MIGGTVVFLSCRIFCEYTGACFPEHRTPIDRWLENNKGRRNRGERSEQRIRWLNTLNVIWKVDVFPKYLEELKAFKAVHGHCNVPRVYPENRPLGHRQLDALGFVWNIREDAWLRNFDDLCGFIEKHNAYPPQTDKFAPGGVGSFAAQSGKGTGTDSATG